MGTPNYSCPGCENHELGLSRLKIIFGLPVYCMLGIMLGLPV